MHLSSHMMSTLNRIASNPHGIPAPHIQRYNMATIKALFDRRFIKQVGDRVVETALGHEFRTDKHGNLRRNAARPISESVMSYLIVSRLKLVKRRAA